MDKDGLIFSQLEDANRHKFALDQESFSEFIFSRNNLHGKSTFMVNMHIFH